MTATSPRTSGETQERPELAAPGGPVRSTPPSAGTGLTLRDFMGGPDTRLSDLLAFGMAVESGRPPTPDGIETLRRQAEADLQAHAFRVLHNQVESIRRQAMDEQMARSRAGGLGFGGAVAANLLALAVVGALVLFGPTLDVAAIDVTPVTDRLAQLLAQISAR